MSKPVLWDTNADCALRYGLLILFFGHACSRRAACVSDFACFGTLVQMALAL